MHWPCFLASVVLPLAVLINQRWQHDLCAWKLTLRKAQGYTAILNTQCSCGWLIQTFYWLKPRSKQSFLVNTPWHVPNSKTFTYFYQGPSSGEIGCVPSFKMFWVWKLARIWKLIHGLGFPFTKIPWSLLSLVWEFSHLYRSHKVCDLM